MVVGLGAHFAVLQMDVHEPEIRSYNMSRIRSKDTKPEMLVRKFLFAHGFRYSLHNKSLPGKPDIVLRKYKTVIFVHGCFWHGHQNCKYYVVPKTKTDWWLEKISGNIKRDNKNKRELITQGWKVITVFECDLKPVVRQKTLNSLVRKLSKIDAA